MDDQFKVCGNCCEVTLAGGKFVCMNPVNPKPIEVGIGDRRECFKISNNQPEPSMTVH